MSFFDKKEEVMDLILTEKGREKFSSGSLNPKYYIFDDRDIIYDNERPVEQNTIADRIKDDVRIKNIPVLFDVKSKSRPYFLVGELGETEILTQSAPAWKVEFLEGSMDSASFIHYPTEIKNTSSFEMRSNEERIPQLNIEVTYDLYTKNSSETNLFFFEKSSEDLLVKIEEKNVVYDEDNQELFFEVFDINYIEDKRNNNNISASLSKLNLDDGDFSKINANHYVNIMIDEIALLNHKKKTKNIYGNKIIEDKNICEDI
tara:strand:- start:224 stop:1003 length:780 start_codon:yes stop_codon:yes gene_type:complete